MTSRVDRIADASPEIGRLGFERVVFFSDAVFAIAMTLLVVDLRLPDLATSRDGDIAAALWAGRWDVFAYVLSILVIGSFWLAHWRRYHHIQRIDGRHAFINLLFLGAVAFIPFPTSVLGTAGDQPIAVAFYAVAVSVAAILGVVAVWDAWHRQLYASSVSRPDIKLWVMSGLLVPVVMLTSLLLLPFIGPSLTELSWITAAVVGGMLPGRRA